VKTGHSAGFRHGGDHGRMRSRPTFEWASYRGQGLAAPVVLIHGLLGHLAFPELTTGMPGFDVFAPDLPGFGRLASTPPDQVSIEHHVAWLERGIHERFGDQPVNLVAHSVGGVTAMLFAHRHPSRVRAIVNAEGNLSMANAFWSSTLAHMSSDEIGHWLGGMAAAPDAWLRRYLVEPTVERVDRASDWIAYQPPESIRAMAESVLAETAGMRFRSRLLEVMHSHRVHLVAGDRSLNDWNLPHALREQAASLTLIHGTGHLMVLEDPHAFARGAARCLDAG